MPRVSSPSRTHSREMFVDRISSELGPRISALTDKAEFDAIMDLARAEAAAQRQLAALLQPNRRRSLVAGGRCVMAAKRYPSDH